MTMIGMNDLTRFTFDLMLFNDLFCDLFVPFRPVVRLQ